MNQEAVEYALEQGADQLTADAFGVYCKDRDDIVLAWEEFIL